MEQRPIFRALAFTGVLGALAVGLGALGAHALKGQMLKGNITSDQLNAFDTGVRYHMYHTLALLAIVLLRLHFNVAALRFAFRFFVAGIALFSGSLYLLSTRELFGAPWLTVLGPVTPIGGLLLMAGWLCLCWSLFNKR